LTSFTPGEEFFSLSGFAVLQINYRGSLGFGKSNLESVLGLIGTNDVKDCIESLTHFLNKFPRIDEKNIFYTGGSHGGFLGSHLASKDSRIKAFGLRNPVINCSNMIGVTDIPDWVLSESGIKMDSEVDLMFKCSPYADVEKIKSPILIFLGDTDRRVPNSQGKQLYYKLKTMGIPCAMKIYPKTGHAISRIDVEADHYLNTLAWFQQFSTK